jgi:hypothetical protein
MPSVYIQSAIMQDRRGVLYMGRRKGVHEFDGVEVVPDARTD